eukprot:GHVH01013133.1.p1 GENE.GHVH01013133.1~~GHVH01013133.1.p1  ORF type:complete len:146 (+),score=17.25 GHVH01013133.1:42-479(+)
MPISWSKLNGLRPPSGEVGLNRIMTKSITAYDDFQVNHTEVCNEIRKGLQIIETRVQMVDNLIKQSLVPFEAHLIEKGNTTAANIWRGSRIGFLGGSGVALAFGVKQILFRKPGMRAHGLSLMVINPLALGFSSALCSGVEVGLK